jgi:hypothetical protein
MPALTVDVVKTVISGTIVGSQSWSTGPWWLSPFGTIGPLQSELNAFAAAVSAQFASQSGTFFSGTNVAATKLTAVTAYFYPAGQTHATMVSTTTTSNIPGTGTDQLPSLLALVISLHSPIPGKSGRGRAYLPLTKFGALDTTGQVTQTVLTDVLTGWKAALNNVSALSTWSGPPEPIVASWTKGDVYDIRSLSCNSLVDTQHRREDSVAIARNTVLSL